MPLGDSDAATFFGDDFAVDLKLSKTGPPALAVATTGIWEDAVIEETSGARAAHDSTQPQVTVRADVARDFGEGDSVVYAGTTYEIVDKLPSDGAQTTLLLTV